MLIFDGGIHRARTRVHRVGPTFDWATYVESGREESGVGGIKRALPLEAIDPNRLFRYEGGREAQQRKVESRLATIRNSRNPT